MDSEGTSTGMDSVITGTGMDSVITSTGSDGPNTSTGADCVSGYISGVLRLQEANTRRFELSGQQSWTSSAQISRLLKPACCMKRSCGRIEECVKNLKRPSLSHPFEADRPH